MTALGVLALPDISALPINWVSQFQRLALLSVVSPMTPRAKQDERKGGVYRSCAKPQRPRARQRSDPPLLIDPEEDFAWPSANPAMLGRVHRTTFGPPPLEWSVFVIARRISDPGTENGWRPAWLEVHDNLTDDPDAPPLWPCRVEGY